MTDLSTFAGRWFVLKIGGELLADPRSLASGIGQAVRELSAAGIKIAIVHGGGPQATQLSQRLQSWIGKLNTALEEYREVSARKQNAAPQTKGGTS